MIFNKLKKIVSITLLSSMLFTTTASAFMQNDTTIKSNASVEEKLINETQLNDSQEELFEEGELSNSIDLEVQDINEQLKEAFPYGEIVEVKDSEFGKIYYIDNEYHKTRKKRNAWDVLDFVMAGASWADFFDEPSFKSFGWAALDTVALAPLLPSSAYFRKGSKVLVNIDELKIFAKTSKGKQAITKTLKVVDAISLVAHKIAKNYNLPESWFKTHIVGGHGPDATDKNKSKFDRNADIKDLIDTTLHSPFSRVSKEIKDGKTSYVFEYTFGWFIGTKTNRLPTKTIRVIMGENGFVVSAFPI